MGKAKQVNNKMKEKNRKIGIDIIDNVSWGTHLCQFYRTKEDLIDILVPYFKAGLESNEFCMWVVSEPLKVEDAKKALKKVVKKLDEYIKKGQIEILDYSQWYTKSGRFEADKVLKGWVGKEKKALKRGFDGLRLTGNTFWLDKKNWKSFVNYEEIVNNVIGEHRMIAICSYALNKCNASEIIDVVHNHQQVLVKREGKWRVVESSERKKAEEKIISLAKFPFENPAPVFRVDHNGGILYANETSGEFLAKCCGRKVGQRMPDDFYQVIKEIINTNESKCVEHECEGRIFSLKVIPVKAEGYVNVYGEDITKRKKAQEKLQESEERFRGLFEHAPISLWEEDWSEVKAYLDKLCTPGIGDLDAYFKKHPKKIGHCLSLVKLIDANNITLELFGARNKEELLGNLGDIIAEESWGVIRGLLIALKKGQTHYKHDEVLHTVSGEKINVTFYFDIFSGYEENWSKVLVSIVDITERKKAEKELRESEEKYKTLAENLKELIYRADPDTFVTSYINSSVENIYGYTVEEWLRDPELWTTTIHPDDKKRVIAQFTKARKKLENGTVVYRIMRKDKLIRWVEDHYTFEKNKQGQAVSLNGILHDITNRKNLEDEIKKSAENWQKTFAAIPDLVSIQNKDYKFVNVNKAYCDTLKMKSEEIVGKTCYEVIHGTKEPWPICPHKQAVESKRHVVEEFFEPRLGLYLEVSASPIFDEKDNVTGTVHVAKNVTERKKAEEEQRKTEENHRKVIENILEFIPEGLLVFTDKLNIYKKNKAFQNIIKKYAAKLNYTEDELAEIIIKQAKNRIVNSDYTEIKVSKKQA